MRPRRNPISKRLGSALVMTLVIIVLITVVTVGYLASVMLETKTAGSSLDQERAYGIAMVGAHQAMAKIREALGPWDDPYKNFAASNPPFYWSLSPGRITRWSYSSVNPQMNIGLFSESAGTNLVNLNRQLIDGSHPIIGGSNAPEVSVKWANLLRDPTRPASATNAIVGRYAFWVDDEGAKINVNTADGTEKYTTNSLGIGTPSEVSLGVLFGTNTNGVAKEVVQMARTNGFTSPREILRVSGVTNSAFADNVFSLTAHSRAPELNVFGEPRLSVAPLLGNGGFGGSNMVLNSLTLVPPREIYPTPTQLRPYVIASRYDVDTGALRNHPWPLALRGELGVFPAGIDLFHPYAYALREGPRDAPNYSYNQGFLLAKYLSGTNDLGRPLNWPVFPGSSTQGFAGKYAPRQLDSLVAQILSIGSKAISSDYPHISGNVGEQIGHRFMVVPYLFPGWLSGKWVNGIGRSPKVTQMYMRIAAFGSPTPTNSPTDAGYEPPFATFDIWLEWWVPVGYFGGRKVLNFQASEFYVGHRATQATLNVIDMPRQISTNAAAPLSRAPDGNSGEVDGFWADQLLRNNQGIDLAGNPGIVGTNLIKDHSQTLAGKFHDPYALFNRTNPPDPISNPWRGDGRAPPFLPSGRFYDYASPFFMTDLEPDVAPASEWQPGEMRVIRSRLGDAETGGSPYQYSMQTSASTTLVIEGGIAVKAQMKGGFLSDPDPVPLEAIRGPYDVDGISTEEPYTNFQGFRNRFENELDDDWEINTPGEGTLRERVRDSVIPVNANVGVAGGPQFVTATVEDPLVNKFPGDWNVVVQGTSSSTISPTLDRYYENESVQGGTFRGRLTDPDSYWMPQADAGLCSSIADVANQTQIPRSARMPNIGYLQYVRTGIIPDDESLSYSAQHGTPFRLLNFAPSTDASAQRTTLSGSASYPDWALLDLMYIPSTLAPFGSTYNPTTANPSTNAGVTNLLYYGTYGGATAGKINPNGAVIYTTNADVAQTNVSRRLPLESVLSGVRINQTITGVSTNATFTNGSAVDASTIAQAIENYVRTNAPLRMPGEICNVPEIADLHATNNPTRNDLVRQVVGALTTQGNVFSVWTVGQAVNKKPANTQYDEFQAGDNVLAEVRLRFIVERYLDPGSDNVYGNSANPGADGVVGTYDDPVDPGSHPFQPRYLYRVLASEEIR